MRLDITCLILTSDCGFGHRKAAKAIDKAISERYPGEVSTSIINPILETPAPRLLKQTELDYDRTVTQSPQWYKFTYDISNSRPACVLVEDALVLMLKREIANLIRTIRPDVIVNTFQSYTAPIGSVLRSLPEKIPFCSVVTDLADVHSLWFNSSPDRYFVASEYVRSKAISCGIPENKIAISGIPVDPDFSKRKSARAQLQKSLGLDPALPVLLFVGSQRVRAIPDYLEALNSVPHPFQVVVIAGGDHDLYRNVSQRKWQYPIQAYDFVTNVPEWMLCSDILISKAGGLILSEGLAAGLPVFLIDYLVGQEESNVRYILNHEAGDIVESPSVFSSKVDHWLANDQSQLKILSSNARQLGHADSSIAIADYVYQTAQRKKTRNPQSSGAWRNLG
jgi:1,2-diacylglycerol 3-beta-galactosyltransferase